MSSPSSARQLVSEKAFAHFNNDSIHNFHIRVVPVGLWSIGVRSIINTDVYITTSTKFYLLIQFSSSLSGTDQGLFNNAAQSWNHDFYWKCMKAGGGGAPTGKIAAMIDAQFGSYDKFKSEFMTAGKQIFLRT